MIGQIDIEKSLLNAPNDRSLFVAVASVVNSLVDAVNELQKQIDKVSCAILDLATPNGENKALKSIQVEPADPYAEQRKWIGKLCRCWDSDINNDTWGILQDIKDNETEKYYIYGIGHEHCEPVKPDDPIIYKGEKCETPTKNVQPDYVATAYVTDGYTKEYYGQNGASIVTDHPLPAGYVIAINEPETKGGDNE